MNEKVQKIIKKIHNKEFVSLEDMEKLTRFAETNAERVEELEDTVVNKIMPEIEKGYEQNQRYGRALKVATEELHYALNSNKSDDVKRFYVENAKRFIDEALKENQNERKGTVGIN